MKTSRTKAVSVQFKRASWVVISGSLRTISSTWKAQELSWAWGTESPTGNKNQVGIRLLVAILEAAV